MYLVVFEGSGFVRVDAHMHYRSPILLGTMLHIACVLLLLLLFRVVFELTLLLLLLLMLILLLLW